MEWRFRADPRSGPSAAHRDVDRPGHRDLVGRAERVGLGFGTVLLSGSTPEAARCIVRYDERRCPNAAVGGIEMCGPCLTVVLREADPGRRRALAGVTRAPSQLIERLAHDPDPGVRARLATRDDLDPAIARRFSDPATEPSEIVWRALAATATGAHHAATLLSSGDRLTGLILATNPATGPSILGQLAGHPDPQVASTVAAIRSGRPPDSAVISQVLDARAIPSRPLASPPPGTAWPGPGDGPDHTLEDRGVQTIADDTPARHRGLVIGLVALVAVILVFAMVVITVGPGPDRKATAPSPTTASGRPALSSTTVHPSVPSSVTAPSTSATHGAVTVDIQMSAGAKRFCGEVKIRITYDAPTTHVVITDDAGRELWEGPWHSGQAETVRLFAPTRTLHARMTTSGDPDAFRPVGSVDGSFC